MNRRAWLWAKPGCLALIAVVLSFGPAHAADPKSGYRLAKQWCATCHIVAPGEAGSDAARPFESIAKDPNFTEDGIRAWLSNPHPPMPDLHLSREEIDRVVAYLQSLQQ
jgi:mono/diheme cytochrome c family protein